MSKTYRKGEAKKNDFRAIRKELNRQRIATGQTNPQVYQYSDESIAKTLRAICG